MPIKRFADWLLRRHALEEYMQLLVNAFNPAAVEGVMCKDTVNVSWDGRLYDCDFNQQLDMPMKPTASSTNTRRGNSSSSSTGTAASSSTKNKEGCSESPTDDNGFTGSAAMASSVPQQHAHQRPAGLSVWDISCLSELTGRTISVDNHCFGCTAGAGSSCQGATL